MVSEAPRDGLVGDVAQALDTLLDAICLQNSWPVMAKEIQPDHVHLFVTIPPAIAVADAVKILKGTTARKMFVQFRSAPQTANWTSVVPSDYVGTVGNVSADRVRKYIERSAHMEKRR